jgi:hypothetical protein
MGAIQRLDGREQYANISFPKAGLSPTGYLDRLICAASHQLFAHRRQPSKASSQQRSPPHPAELRYFLILTLPPPSTIVGGALSGAFNWLS